MNRRECLHPHLRLVCLLRMVHLMRLLSSIKLEASLAFAVTSASWHLH